jgi:ribosome-associated translation inhibitor RaiA
VPRTYASAKHYVTTLNGAFALRWTVSPVGSGTVRVKLADPNCPRGGTDKCCKLAISLDRSSTIVMESQASNVYAAIDCIADKAATYIGRRLKRPHGRKTLRPVSELLVQESTNVVMPADLQPGGAP